MVNSEVKHALFMAYRLSLHTTANFKYAVFFLVETSIKHGMRKPHRTIFHDTLLNLGTDA